MQLSYLFRLLLIVEFCHTFLLFDDLDSLRNGSQVFCRMLSY